MLKPEDVVFHLGRQEKHWKAGRSAHALSALWYRQNALPQSVKSALVTRVEFESAKLIDAFLERVVDLRTPGRPSQTDLLAVISLVDKLAIMAVEAKAGEPFGSHVSEWNDGGSGKRLRLSALCRTLNIAEELAGPLRYQLLHRAASAIYEAQRYKTDVAIMLIESFAPDDKSFVDFAAFLHAIGEHGEVSRSRMFGPFDCEGVAFYAGWIDEDPESVDRDQSRCLQELRRYADQLSLYCDRLRAWCDGRASKP